MWCSCFICIWKLQFVHFTLSTRWGSRHRELDGVFLHFALLAAVSGFWCSGRWMTGCAWWLWSGQSQVSFIYGSYSKHRRIKRVHSSGISVWFSCCCLYLLLLVSTKWFRCCFSSRCLIIFDYTSFFALVFYSMQLFNIIHLTAGALIFLNICFVIQIFFFISFYRITSDRKMSIFYSILILSSSRKKSTKKIIGRYLVFAEFYQCEKNRLVFLFSLPKRQNGKRIAIKFVTLRKKFVLPPSKLNEIRYSLVYVAETNERTYVQTTEKQKRTGLSLFFIFCMFWCSLVD